MVPCWPGHYFCQFEKSLPQPEISDTPGSTAYSLWLFMDITVHVNSLQQS